MAMPYQAKMLQGEEYPCTKCGLCCRMAGNFINQAKNLVAQGLADDLVKEMANFPHKTDKRGWCEHLQPDNSCGIYETRPDVCKNLVSYKKHLSHKITLQDFYVVAADNCNRMILNAGLPPRYLVKV